MSKYAKLRRFLNMSRHERWLASFGSGMSDRAYYGISELRALLEEHDRAVEVLRLAKRAFARPLDLELFGEAGGAVWEFLRELEGSDG